WTRRKSSVHSLARKYSDEVVMDSQKQRDLIASLYEELVIARGLIKEICTVRSIAEPKASLQRMDKAIKEAKDMLENI
ncbi:hypothetical protein ACX6OI_004911, partial [Salmonella enterica subsp. diarizonae serovar 65:(k):z]